MDKEAPNPNQNIQFNFERRSSKLNLEEKEDKMNFKVILNQDPIPGYKMQEEVLMSGDSYGSTNCE